MSQRNRAHTTGAARKQPEQAKSPKNAKNAKGAKKATGSMDAAPVAANDQEREQHRPASLSPETLARTLRAVAAELERDPELARRISGAIAGPEAPPSDTALRQPTSEHGDTGNTDEGDKDDERVATRQKRSTFRPRLITGASPDLGPGIPDPFTLQAKRGEEGLRAALEELRLGTLRAIVREHHLDPEGKLTRQNDAARLRVLILEAVARNHD